MKTIPSQSERTYELYEYGEFCLKCTVYYRDDDNNSGCGDNPQVAYWYGPYEDAPLEPADEAWLPYEVLASWRRSRGERGLF